MGWFHKAEETHDTVLKQHSERYARICTLAMVGNPNVGKSTVFNGLTGLKQHTGNWAGKTVEQAEGYVNTKDGVVKIVDLPGTNTLSCEMAEETLTREFLFSQQADAVIVVCDASCLARSLSLVLEVLELTSRVVVCVNLTDEARRKGISIHIAQLEALLGTTATETAVRFGGQKNYGYKKLIHLAADAAKQPARSCMPVVYPAWLEQALDNVAEVLSPFCPQDISPRYAALRAVSGDTAALLALFGVLPDETEEALLNICASLPPADEVAEAITRARHKRAVKIAHCVAKKTPQQTEKAEKADRFLMGKGGYFVMAGLFFLLLWLTIKGANYPSQMLADLFSVFKEYLKNKAVQLRIPSEMAALFIDGVYTSVTTVISVMLPPMAIFFPLFTLLEDSGYLPRVAFHSDSFFQRCGACGKQAITMCMGFGCNAAGVVGARIIRTRREKLLAILTNSFIPCNGRLPSLIAVISMFCVSKASGSFSSALILFLILALSVFMTFLCCSVLSKTLLSGEDSFFALELPAYRMPRFGQVLVRSVFDRTARMLARAVKIAAPCGLVLWLMANCEVGNQSILLHFCDALAPLGRALGMDGVILMAYILSLPANETMLPIVLMGYLATGSMQELPTLYSLREILTENGWSLLTAVNVMLFTVFHWPCSTTLLTVYKETASVKYTVLSALIPTGIGTLLCLFTTAFVRFLSL